MFKSIMKAIAGALKGAFRVMRALVFIPGQAIRAALGFAPDDDFSPSPAPLDLDDEEGGPELSRKEFYARAAADVLSWVADSLIDDTPAPVPVGMPIELAWWIPGLSRDECETLINCGCDEIALHLQGLREIEGVRAVQPLLAQGWPANPRNEPADAVAVTCDAEPAEPAPARP